MMDPSGLGHGAGVELEHAGGQEGEAHDRGRGHDEPGGQDLDAPGHGLTLVLGDLAAQRLDFSPESDRSRRRVVVLVHDPMIS
jgi:hypothetical protein